VRLLRPLWRWLRWLLLAYVAASIAYTAASLWLAMSPAALQTVVVLDFGLTLMSAPFAIASIAMLSYSLIFYWCGFLWLKLTYRAMRNLREIGAKDLTISPVGAVGWHFFPILQLWMPLRAIRQIWRASSDPDQPASVPVPAQISGWWALWVGSLVLGVATIANDPATTGVGAAQMAWINVVGAALYIPMTLLALWFWPRIVELQDTRWQAAQFA
jgi:hypothetical protein